jgi:hypothetical protein
MTTLRQHLKDGYVELLDSFGDVAAEWWDRKYAQAILNEECTVYRWHQIFHELAVREAYIILIDGSWLRNSHNGRPN